MSLDEALERVGSLLLDHDRLVRAVGSGRRKGQERPPWRRVQLRYVDLGLSRGFEADLVVDDAGLVLHYEHLFERIAPPV